MKQKGISSVVGVILILAILASTLTVFLTYKLPILQKRAEFKYENDRLNEFSKVVNAYNKNSSSVVLNLGGATIFGTLHTDSTLSLKKSGKIKVIVSVVTTNYTSNSTLTSTKNYNYTGNFTALNYTIFCTRLPRIKASVSEGGMKLYQNGKSIKVIQPETISLNNRKLTIYVENSEGNFLNEVAGTGYASIKVSCRSSVVDWEVSKVSKINGSTVYKNISISINVTDKIFNATWYNKLSKLGKVKVNGKSLYLYIPHNNLSKIANVVEIVRRNVTFSIY